MARPKSARRDPFEDAFRAPAKSSRALPQAFVLEALESLDPRTRPMFGCLSVYVDDRIVFILREKGGGDPDDGVWVGFEPQHEAEVRAAFPRLEPIEVFEGRVSGWLKLSSKSPEFEEDVFAACKLVRARDRRIGKVPNARKPRKAAKKAK